MLWSPGSTPKTPPISRKPEKHGFSAFSGKVPKPYKNDHFLTPFCPNLTLFGKNTLFLFLVLKKSDILRDEGLGLATTYLTSAG